MKCSKIIRKIAYAAIIVSLACLWSGCKKNEEVKVEQAPAPASAPAPAAPQSTQGVATAANAAMPDEGFKAEINVNNPPAALNAKSITPIEVKVKNISNITWLAKGQDGKFNTALAYHWLDKKGKAIKEGDRTALPNDLNPGNELVLSLKVKAPDKSGDYILVTDMVQEGVAWFNSKGSKTSNVNVKVE